MRHDTQDTKTRKPTECPVHLRVCADKSFRYYTQGDAIFLRTWRLFSHFSNTRFDPKATAAATASPRGVTDACHCTHAMPLVPTDHSDARLPYS